MFKKVFFTILLLVGLLSPAVSFGEEGGAPGTQAPAIAEAMEETAQVAMDPVSKLEETVAINKVALDTVWVLVAAFLVFWMNEGFALVESGLCRAKNTINILAKNLLCDLIILK